MIHRNERGNVMDQVTFDDEFGEKEKDKKVECLGRTFASENERREYFRDLLREKLKDPEFRKIEGFPIGEDEDIIALSDPPYYTACPNPWINDFIKLYGEPYDPDEKYHREPFAADVSEGKNDPIYNAHSYHTKVPHKAIMRYILHYTEPGDIVFDGFCGTGMTGVAAKLSGDRSVVQSLGYKLETDGTILQKETDEQGTFIWKPFAKLGARRAVLNDLSPAATFIAYNYNTPADIKEFEKEAKRILKEVEEECGWMYETIHTDGLTKGKINYTVWSDVFVCPECTNEIIFWEVAVDKKEGKVRNEFQCPNCKVSLTKRKLERAWVTKYDKAINRTIKQAKQIPVLINYTVGNKRYEKEPDDNDFKLLIKIENSEIPYWFPINELPEGYNTEQPKKSHGFTHVHHFYTKRNLWNLSALYNSLLKSKMANISKERFFIQYSCLGFSKLSRYVPTHFSQVNRYLTGTLYVGSQQSEVSPTYILYGKLDRLIKRELNTKLYIQNIIMTSDTANINLNNEQIDYIFTDPPFGSNLMYSELNNIWESWLKVFTNNKPEAIENKVQGKGLFEYQQLMTLCFKEYYRILKPGRWMTVEFHNSKNSVWNSIQEGIQDAGFVVADVRTLDKKQGTFKQVTTGGAVKQDLIISAYKPNYGLEEKFKLKAGTEDGAWDFVRTHLRQLPIFVGGEGKSEIITERQDYLLFDRMVAFHIQRGVGVPLSASEFYEGLRKRFVERDGMFFLPEQASEYDRKRMNVREMIQQKLFVIDENSAIQWIKQQLTKKPQTFQEIHPQFLREIGGWSKNEKPMELRELLDENFLRYESGPLPSPIVSWMKKGSELREIIQKEISSGSSREDDGMLVTSNPVLIKEAKDRYYVPDPRRAQDLEKLREKSLMKEFNIIASSKGKVKQFRMEACRMGFKKLWHEGDYQSIVDIAKKLPTNVVEEDRHLLMYLSNARNKLDEE